MQSLTNDVTYTECGRNRPDCAASCTRGPDDAAPVEREQKAITMAIAVVRRGEG